MKIIVVSRGDLQRCHTLYKLSSEYIDNIHEITVVAHDKKIKNRLKEKFPEFKVVSSGTKHLVDKRNWILEKLVEKNEWFIGCDDNIQYFTRVYPRYLAYSELGVTGPPPKGFASWREVYNRKIDTPAWFKEFNTSILEAESEDIPLVGVATMENPYFRARRYSNYRFVKTKIYAMKNTGKLWFENKLSHDSWLSAQCVARHGKVLVDSYLHYKVRMYEPGGLGTREEREKLGLLKYLKHTCDSFPGLVMPARGQNSALRFRLTREGSVEKWREENGYV